MRISDWSSDVCSSDLSHSPTAAEPVWSDTSTWAWFVRAAVPTGPRALTWPWNTRTAEAAFTRGRPRSTPGTLTAEQVDRSSGPVQDRKRVEEGNSGSVRLNLGVHSILTKKTKK